VAQHVDISNRLPAIGEHHRHISEHLAPMMNRRERPPCQRCRNLTGQTDPVGQKPQASATGMSDHARPITRY